MIIKVLLVDPTIPFAVPRTFRIGNYMQDFDKYTWNFTTMDDFLEYILENTKNKSEGQYAYYIQRKFKIV